jgi:hypothetical protein
MTFDFGITALGFNWRNTDQSGDEIELIVGNQSITFGPAQQSGFFGIITDQPFTVVGFSDTPGGGSALAYGFIDDIRYGAASTPVTIDVKPGRDPVCNGVMPIAILGSDTLDVIQIDQTTLSFEGGGVRLRGDGALSCNIRDANRDGYYDLVCQYEDITTEGTLTGELLDGTFIKGADTFCIGN